MIGKSKKSKSYCKTQRIGVIDEDGLGVKCEWAMRQKVIMWWLYSTEPGLHEA